MDLSAPGLGHLDQLPTLQVALYSGVALERDAVSHSFMHKLRIFDRLKDHGYPLEATAFTHHSDLEHPSLHVIPDLMSLLRYPGFDSFDLHIFEYGMAYEMFNALFLVDRPTMVVDHNTTPPQFVDDAHAREICVQTAKERANLTLATRIAVDGEFTRDQLLDLGIEADRLSVLHLPPTNSSVGRSDHSFDVRATGGFVRLLYVGRLVRAKGIQDLLTAVQSLWHQGVEGFTLTLAGSLRFSDVETVAAINQAVARFGRSGKLVHVVDATDEEIADLYGSCDALVMPSYHEGYCVPVAEAMMSGCYVIGSDAGNLPTIMGGLGSVFETGNVAGLARAIDGFVAAVQLTSESDRAIVLPTSSGPMTLPDWHRAVALHLKEYSHEHFEREFLRLVGETLAEGGPVPEGWLSMFDHPGDQVIVGAP